MTRALPRATKLQIMWRSSFGRLGKRVNSSIFVVEDEVCESVFESLTIGVSCPVRRWQRGPAERAATVIVVELASLECPAFGSALVEDIADEK
jgi:hypothetical protein